MKKIIIFAVFILATCSLATAQTPREVFDKVKEIRLLEDKRNDVKRILVNYEAGDFEEQHYDYFFTGDGRIEVSYAGGNCIENEKDEDDDEVDVAEIWNVAEWTATKIIIEFDGTVAIEDIGYDLSKLEKEKEYPESEDSLDFIYNNKNLGIAFFVDEEDNEIEKIIFYPPKSNYSSLCDNKQAKKFASSKGWFGGGDLRVIFDVDKFPNVDDLTLSATELTAPCGSQNKNSAGKALKISVKTVATDPENDVLTYHYTISGGRIIGQGANVVWDLTGVKPGTYTITAGADDGCGICGETKTQTVLVRECPSDRQK